MSRILTGVNVSTDTWLVTVGDVTRLIDISDRYKLITSVKIVRNGRGYLGLKEVKDKLVEMRSDKTMPL